VLYTDGVTRPGWPIDYYGQWERLAAAMAPRKNLGWLRKFASEAWCDRRVMVLAHQWIGSAGARRHPPSCHHRRHAAHTLSARRPYPGSSRLEPSASQTRTCGAAHICSAPDLLVPLQAFPQRTASRCGQIARDGSVRRTTPIIHELFDVTITKLDGRGPCVRVTATSLRDADESSRPASQLLVAATSN